METADTGEFDDAVVMQGCEDDVGYAVDDRVWYAVDDSVDNKVADSVGNGVNDGVGNGVADSESLNLYETFDAACKQTINNAYDPRFLVGGFDDRPYGQAATAWVAPFNMETNGPLWVAQARWLYEYGSITSEQAGTIQLQMATFTRIKLAVFRTMHMRGIKLPFVMLKSPIIWLLVPGGSHEDVWSMSDTSISTVTTIYETLVATLQQVADSSSGVGAAGNQAPQTATDPLIEPFLALNRAQRRYVEAMSMSHFFKELRTLRAQHEHMLAAWNACVGAVGPGSAASLLWPMPPPWDKVADRARVMSYIEALADIVYAHTLRQINIIEFFAARLLGVPAHLTPCLLTPATPPEARSPFGKLNNEQVPQLMRYLENAVAGKRLRIKETQGPSRQPLALVPTGTRLYGYLDAAHVEELGYYLSEAHCDDMMYIDQTVIDCQSEAQAAIKRYNETVMFAKAKASMGKPVVSQ